MLGMVLREQTRRGLRAMPRALLWLATAVGLAACSPALDWRDVRPKGVDILVTYPCKPEQVTKIVELAGQKVPMSMTGCVADGMTFALAHARLSSPQQGSQALALLHQSAIANVRGKVDAAEPARVNAASRDPSAARLRIDGVMPDGQPVREQVLLFRQGADVFQLTVFAPTDKFKDDAAQTFGDSVRLSPAP